MDKPAEPGWYWYLLASGHVTVSKIDVQGERLFAGPHETEEEQEFVDNLDGYWCGPIQHLLFQTRSNDSDPTLLSQACSPRAQRI
jgi:hypothetical protein